MFGAACFSPDGQYLAVGGDWVTVWDGAGEHQLFAIAKEERVVKHNCQFSPNGLVLATADMNHISLYNFQTRKSFAKLTTRTTIDHLCFSPDSASIAIACGNEFFLWDIRSNQKQAIANPKGGISGLVSFSPDGKLVACSSWDDTIIYDVTTRRAIWQNNATRDLDVQGMQFSGGGVFLRDLIRHRAWVVEDLLQKL